MDKKRMLPVDANIRFQIKKYKYFLGKVNIRIDTNLTEPNFKQLNYVMLNEIE